jgi:hypothetical protein
MVTDRIKTYFSKTVHIAPLAVFRMAFGVLMLASVCRFILKGWVYQMYVEPEIFFPFFGFEWLKPLGEIGMYTVFVLMALSALLIAIGFLFRYAAITFFVLFTYVELLDKTNYLNHYYFISIASLILIFLPANRYFSVDSWRNKNIRATHIPKYFLLAIKFQVFIVYFFAGLAKVNSDWLLHAQPLRIWLPAHSDMFLIGPLLSKAWVAFVFSWFGCLYDLLVPFFLFSKKYVKKAYFFVIVFHLATSLFFNIGMFPYIMITLTCIFFREEFHITVIEKLRKMLRLRHTPLSEVIFVPRSAALKLLSVLFFAHFTIQLVLPFRYLFYPGELFWTEQGFRFSWRVMLIEKAGTAFFYVRDPETGRETEISNCDYLTSMQEKMMATQPDMLVDYAHFLKKEYEKKGIKNPEVRAESYVTLNGRASRLIVDKNTDLGKINDNWEHKSWVLPAGTN